MLLAKEGLRVGNSSWCGTTLGFRLQQGPRTAYRARCPTVLAPFSRAASWPCPPHPPFFTRSYSLLRALTFSTLPIRYRATSGSSTTQAIAARSENSHSLSVLFLCSTHSRRLFRLHFIKLHPEWGDLRTGMRVLPSPSLTIPSRAPARPLDAPRRRGTASHERRLAHGHGRAVQPPLQHARDRPQMSVREWGEEGSYLSDCQVQGHRAMK